MNEEELKKGCGKYFESDLEDYMEDKIIGYECNENHLCPTCQARLEGFQKGRLEQKKEEFEFLIKKISVNHIISRFEFLDIIKDRIKQLQKEIGGEKQDDNS